MFTPIPQYRINKSWITSFSHTFLTKPQLQADCGGNHACSFGMSADKLLKQAEFNTTFPVGKRSLHIPGQFGIIGHQEFNAKHSACISTNDSLHFVTQASITCVK